MVSFTSLALLVGLASAAALDKGEPPTRVYERASTCTPSAGGSSSTDDVPALEAAISACPSGTIVIPASTTYYVNSEMSFSGCKGCTVQIEGTLKVASDTDYWDGKTAIFTMSGISGATVYSKTGSGLIDGNGQDAWDLFAENSSYARPTLWYITGSSSDITIQNLYFKNAPNVFHSCTKGTSNINYIDVTLSAVSKSDNAPKNTDGWDVSGSYVTISGATVTNDDDCVAFKSNANYVTVTDITCTGSHGLSIGSLGKTHGTTDTVTNIYVSGATMVDSSKAAGIKLYAAGASYGSATVKNVTFEDITVDNSDYAFQIQSCYNGDEDYCEEYPSTATLTDIIVKGVSGTTSTEYKPVVMNLDCPADGTCDVTMSDITVKSPTGSAEFLCANTPSDLGVTCTSGASGK